MTGRIKKILKKLACVCISILFMTVSAKATLVDSNSIVRDGIEYYIQTDKSVYDLGESVEMLYRITNLGVEDVTFGFKYQQQCSFEVWDGETRIWYWPGRVNPAGSGFTLQPGEFKEYFKDWDMIDYSGILINPGIYDVTGALMRLAPGYEDRYVPVSVQIEVIPEPATILLLGLGVLLLKARRYCPLTLSCRRWK